MSKKDVKRREERGLVSLSFTVMELRGVTDAGGGACCALPVDFLIEEVLREVPAVHKVRFPGYDGTVRVWVTTSNPQIVEEIAERIGQLGLTVQANKEP